MIDVYERDLLKYVSSLNVSLYFEGLVSKLQPKRYYWHGNRKIVGNCN